MFAGRTGATLAYEDAALRDLEACRAGPARARTGLRAARHGTQDAYVATCPRPSALLRTDLYFPGWSAMVNGASVPVAAHGPFQSVALGRGRSVVVLSFLPPYVPAATLAALVGLLSLCVPWAALAAWRRRRRPRFQGWSEIEGIGTSLPRRPAAADADVEPATGAIPAVVGADGEPATSSVPAVPGAVQASLGGEDDDGPPTSAVALDTTERPAVADPPTIAVPLDRRGDPER